MMVDRFVSPPIDLPEDAADMYRADLVFYDVDHSGPSYEARVFVDNPEADEETPRDGDHGYAGYFTVFGHDGCFGDEGHCLPGNRYTDEFDRRAIHPLEPWTKTVIATEAIKKAIADPRVTTIRVTVVPVVTGDSDAEDRALRFSRVRLLTYEG